jgi:hypothetical protein
MRAVQQSAVVGMRALLRMRAAIAVAFALTLSTAAHAATIVINSLADPGARGICTLRDAITAANKMAKTNGCIAGRGNDWPSEPRFRGKVYSVGSQY